MTWSLLPENDSLQALRICRMAIAILASVIVVALTGVGAWMHFVPDVTFWRLAALVLLFVTGFYACFRSGLNLRLSDPSLTLPMMVAAGLTISVVQVDAGMGRDNLMLLYPVAIMFGVFRFNTRVLIGVALLYSTFFAVATIASVWSYRMAMDLNHEIFRVCFLTAVLMWFAFVGGHISTLRQQLRLTNDELKIAIEKAESLANHDALTGAYSRRYVMELLEREGHRAKRGSGLSIGMLDIDHFKSINDTYGHATGDEVLKRICAIIQSALRETDFLGRYGGEEFIVGFALTPAAPAVMVAERIRKTIAESTMSCLPDGRHMTVSIGVAKHRVPDSIERTLARADAALYKAKAAGRDQVLVAD